MEDDLLSEFRRLVYEEDVRLRAAKVKREQRKERAETQREMQIREDAERSRSLAVDANAALAELKQLLRKLRDGNQRIRLNGRVGIGGDISVRVANRPKYEQAIQIRAPALPANLGITFCPDRSFANLQAFQQYVQTQFLPKLAREVAASAAQYRKDAVESMSKKTWAEIGRPTTGGKSGKSRRDS
jgi:hypothetical protein